MTQAIHTPNLPDYFEEVYGKADVRGVFQGGGSLLAATLVGLLVAFLWISAFSIILFKTMLILDQKTNSDLFFSHGGKMQQVSMGHAGRPEWDEIDRFDWKGFRETQKQEETMLIDENEVEFESEIGGGAFGIVWKGWYRDAPVAIKQLRVGTLATQLERDDFVKESQIMRQIPVHPHVVTFVGMVQQPPAIILEFCTRGSLYHFLRDDEAEKILTSDIMIKLSFGIAAGLSHLHKEGVIHRDLATRNVLLTNNLLPKITDFGERISR